MAVHLSASGTCCPPRTVQTNNSLQPCRPAWWTSGEAWPGVRASPLFLVPRSVSYAFRRLQDGEIDIIENVQNSSYNQVAWHTMPVSFNSHATTHGRITYSLPPPPSLPFPHLLVSSSAVDPPSSKHRCHLTPIPVIQPTTVYRAANSSRPATSQERSHLIRIAILMSTIMPDVVLKTPVGRLMVRSSESTREACMR